MISIMAMTTCAQPLKKNAIKNLYNRLDVHEKAIKYGFIFKAVPIGLAAAILLYMASMDYAAGRAHDAIMEGLVALLVFIIIFLFWNNDMLRTTIVHMS